MWTISYDTATRMVSDARQEEQVRVAAHTCASCHQHWQIGICHRIWIAVGFSRIKLVPGVIDACNMQTPADFGCRLWETNIPQEGDGRCASGS